MRKSITGTERKHHPVRRLLEIPESTVVLPLIVLVGLATLLNPVFVKPANLVSITRIMVLYGFLAIGQTFIIIVDEVDISVGSMVAFAAMFFAYLLNNAQFHWVPALLLTFALSMGLSLVNGLCVVKLKIPAFITTIAMLYICRGGARALTFAKPISVMKAAGAGSFIKFGTAPMLGGLGWGFVFLIVSIVIAQLVLKKTAFGRKVYATGDSLPAARISGVNTDRIKLSAYLISGVMVGMTAMFLLGREVSANPNTGDGWEMYVIAACAIGGVSMTGGAGSMVGTLCGVAMMAAIQNVLNMLAVNSNWQSVVVGVMIIAAVVLDVLRRNRKFGTIG